MHYARKSTKFNGSCTVSVHPSSWSDVKFANDKHLLRQLTNYLYAATRVCWKIFVAGEEQEISNDNSDAVFIQLTHFKKAVLHNFISPFLNWQGINFK